jgi:hypothetical protein
MTAPWIVLVDYNGLADTRKCLDSLALQTRPHQVVVVDNASRENVADALRADYPAVHFVRNAVNGGWAGGNNVGIQYALDHGADLVVLLNNDTIVAPTFVERLEAAAAAHPTFGVFGPVIRFMSPPHDIMTDGCQFNRRTQPGFFERLEVPLRETSPPEIASVDIVNGCCMAIRRAVFEQIGLIDERFFLIHEESDFCLRATRAGWKCGVFAEALVWHKGSSTFKREGSKLQRYYDTRNLALILAKHPHRPQARPLLVGLAAHGRYAFQRYILERQAGFDPAAEAVLQGFYDGYLGHYGIWHPERPRPGLFLLRWLFDTAHRLRQRIKPESAPASPQQETRS